MSERPNAENCRATVAGSWRMDCCLDEVRPTAEAIKTFLAAQDICAADADACELALAEACNNAVQYAPEDAKSKPIDIAILCRAEAVEIHVTDHTNGFDWRDEVGLPAPDEEHGRGLFIIQSVMDHVDYLRGSGENRLIVRKTRTVWGGTHRRDECAPQDPSGDGTLPELSPGELKDRLALSEQAAAFMAKELCFRSEALQAIFRCGSELGKNAAEEFVDKLLRDLLHIVEADWFVLRLKSEHTRELCVKNASRPELEMPPLVIPSETDSTETAGSIELQTAMCRREFAFGGNENPSLAPEDPFCRSAFGSHGLVRPICHGDTLVGTLAIGSDKPRGGFSPEQTDVIRTFCEFLAIQLVNASLQRRELDLQVTARELEIARNIQESLLPKYFPPIPGFGLAGFCLSARHVGGDFYDVFEVAKGRVLLVVADVMGKGIPAALFAATLHTLVRTMSEWTYEPAELLARVNRQMFEELTAVDMFVTAQIVLIDTQKQELILANAGHCPLLVATRSGGLVSASPEGVPLGILPRASFREEIVPLRECAAALLYTDGLTESRNAHGDFFGQERLERWLRESHRHGSTAYERSWHFMADLKSFQSQVPLADDQTFLILSHEDAAQAEATQRSREPSAPAMPQLIATARG